MYITDIHIIVLKCASLGLCVLFCFVTLKMSQNLLEDILHKVTLTKVMSNATHASGLARFSFHSLFLLSLV